MREDIATRALWLRDDAQCMVHLRDDTVAMGEGSYITPHHDEYCMRINVP